MYTPLQPTALPAELSSDVEKKIEKHTRRLFFHENNNSLFLQIILFNTRK
jgi:hypothetical protein